MGFTAVIFFVNLPLMQVIVVFFSSDAFLSASCFAFSSAAASASANFFASITAYRSMGQTGVIGKVRAIPQYSIVFNE